MSQNPNSDVPNVGVAGVRAMIDNARPAPPIEDIDPHTGEPTGDVRAPAPDDVQYDDTCGNVPSGWVGGLPPGCPVVAVGRNKQVYYFMNSDRQLIDLKASGFNANTIMDLLDGHTDFALSYWAGQRGGLDAGAARDNLMAACKAQGLFNPENRMRGRGAWMSDNGGLILHFGDEVWFENPDVLDGFKGFFDGDLQLPGLIGGYVYEADEAMLRPWDAPVGHTEILPVLQRLESWNWTRAYTGPRLMLGWVSMAVLAGALGWRPHIIAQGDSGCGKSTLQDMIGMMLGAGKVQVTDATEAGLASALRNQTLPVMFDEFEAGEDNRKALAVIALMRRSSSGGRRVRGSQDHNLHSSITRSPFFVSMITIPPMESQDLNRAVLLQMRPLVAGSQKFEPDEDEWAELGRKLFRRMLDGWGNFQSRFAVYSAALADGGHSSRGQDTIATLLACADLAIADEAPDEKTLAKWTAGLSVDEMLEYEGVMSDFDKCLAHILQCHPRRWQGNLHNPSIGSLIAQTLSSGDPIDMNHCKKGLEYAGLALVKRRAAAGYDLFIPSAHTAVREIFDKTKWQGISSSMGGWSYSLRMGPEGVWRTGVSSIGGAAKQKGVLVSLDYLLPLEQKLEAEMTADELDDDCGFNG